MRRGGGPAKNRGKKGGWRDKIAISFLKVKNTFLGGRTG